MNRIIEVIYEDNVFKPLRPVEGLDNRLKTWILLYPSEKRGPDELIGTLGRLKKPRKCSAVQTRSFPKLKANGNIAVRARGILFEEISCHS